MFTSSKEFTIEPHCPWYESQQKFGPPNVNWCEPTTCAYINEPANTWSNLSFIIVGLIILKKINNLNDKMLRDFGYIVIVMGLCSFFYHATNNFLTQFIDFLGMFLLTSFMLAQQVKRLRGEDPRNYATLFWFFMFISTCLFWMFDLYQVPIQLIVTLEVIPMLILEVICCAKEKRTKELSWFLGCLITMIVAQTFSMLDHKRLWCEPENLFLHGHALWHIFGGLGMLFLALHLKKIMKKS